MGKKRWGDRRDGTLIRDLDAMHYIMPLIYPNRCDNEAFVLEKVDLTNLNKYLEKKNANNPDYKYNLFQVMTTAILKTITLRPKMSRFIANQTMYQRNEVSASFIVKKEFKDEGGEGLAFIHTKGTETIDDIHNEIYRIVTKSRDISKKDSSTEDQMDIINKLPRFLSRAIVKFVCVLDRHGKVPKSMIESDPYYSSVVISNLGSIKMKAAYHHLTNWGTNSIFLAIGEKKKRPFMDNNGNTSMVDSIEFGLTIDERLADGYYYSNTVKLFKALIENPEFLDEPLNKEVDRKYWS